MPTPSKSVRLHLEARAELQESVLFYRERAGEHWASRFKQRVAEGLQAIASNPTRYPELSELHGVRKIRLTQFPFSILYIAGAEYIWVVAIAHGNRRPDYWKARLL
jgi:toxin ParE1/3/4